ncbi:MAG: shikimate dehydrogenase [Candidatus Krumholzibacteriota bacterium]|nr:shikimate dehydrogenase [Candidatus Krumholzibacteriota bacterium]
MTGEKTLLYGLIGNPVGHSLSPVIMNRAFAQIGLDAVYAAFGVRPQMLDAAINGLYAMGASGANISYPFKEEALYHLDVISSDAELAHAVNTLVFIDDEIHGYNTDAPGTATALELFSEVPIEGNSAFIFGAGGSARAAAYGLLEKGADRVTFGARSREQVEIVVERYGYTFPEQEIDYVLLGNRDEKIRRRDAFCDAGIVINATPVGMSGVAEGNLIEDPEWIDSRQCFFDFVYHPRQTAFLGCARRAGAKTLGGIALLVSQAAESFRIWTDHAFDVKEMAQAVDMFSAEGPSAQRGVN